MRKLFQLSHLDDSPLLTPHSTEDTARHLGESIRLLDDEPVIVVNLDHEPFVDCVGACLEILFAKRSDSKTIVIDPTHTMRIPSIYHHSAGIIVVDTFLSAAFHSHKLRRIHLARAEPDSNRPRRFRVRRSIK